MKTMTAEELKEYNRTHPTQMTLARCVARVDEMAEMLLTLMEKSSEFGSDDVEEWREITEKTSKDLYDIRQTLRKAGTV